MVELGAGYGRWSMRAACALRSFSNLPVFLVAAEAEPAHFQWMKLHFQDNRFDPADHRLVQCAVTDRAGEAMFYVGMPDGGPDAPDEWYGQALTKDYEIADTEVFDRHRQTSVVRHKSGWKSLRVACRTLPELIGDLERVDLIDFDVQGEESKVIRSSAGLLSAKVRGLHIGTHSSEIEASLRQTLGAEGWQCTADFACGLENETPFGPVTFNDGVQSWLNPRLA
jgi:FkbM family methyltransferase